MTTLDQSVLSFLFPISFMILTLEYHLMFPILDFHKYVLDIQKQPHSKQGQMIGWLVVWLVGFLWHINLCKLFNAKSIFMKIVLFQTIQFSMSTQFNC